MANTFDCDPYLRALEEQAHSIGGMASGMLQAMGTYRENAESVLRSVENLKKMINMTRRAMVLVHGDRVIEKVEIKREPESPRPTPTEDWDDRPTTNYLSEQEDWDKDANEPAYTFAIPAYRSVRRVLWGESCPLCGGRPLRCACSN